MQIYIKKNQIPTNKKEKDSNDIKKPHILAVSAAKDDIYPKFSKIIMPEWTLGTRRQRVLPSHPNAEHTNAEHSDYWLFLI